MENNEEAELNQPFKCRECGHVGKTNWTPWKPTATRSVVLGSLFGPIGSLVGIAAPRNSQKRICAKCGSKKLEEIKPV